MARRTSGGMITFGVFNIIVAALTACGGLYGVFAAFQTPQINVNGREFGPELKKHVADKVPLSRVEPFVICAFDLLIALLLVAGSVGLFMAQPWSRWVCIGTAVIALLCLCVHDVFVLGLVRPAYIDFVEKNMPVGIFRDGFVFGFNAAMFAGVCFHVVFLLYYLVMSLCLGLSSAFGDQPESKYPRDRRRRDDDDDSRF